MYLSETSAANVNITPDSADGVRDWNNWFAKFFHFIDVHKEIKGYNYINAKWPNAYNWGDARIQNNQYVTQKYRGEMKKPKYIHLHGRSITSLEKEKSAANSKGFNLRCFPNPFNPSTTISWQNDFEGRVTLAVYDILGRKVQTLVEEFQRKGPRSIGFNGTDLPSGVYFCVLQTGKNRSAMKMVLMK